jgi:hypothetical protein
MNPPKDNKLTKQTTPPIKNARITRDDPILLEEGICVGRGVSVGMTGLGLSSAAGFVAAGVSVGVVLRILRSLTIASSDFPFSNQTINRS